MSTWRHRPDVAWVSSAERVVVLDLLAPALPPFALPKSSAVIWLAIDGVRDEHAVVDEVAAQYGVASVEIAADVRAFIATLGEQGFLEVADQSAVRVSEADGA